MTRITSDSGARMPYDTWREETPVYPNLPVSMQLYGYVAHFESEADAEKYAESVEKNRKKLIVKSR